jgi:hypothetical protein
MTIIPNFILKQLYVAGSLRTLPEGVAFDFKNTIGPGKLSRIIRIMLDEHEFTPDKILMKVDGRDLPADNINEQNPVAFFLDQVITVVLKDAAFPPREYKIVMDLVSLEAGKISFNIKDRLAT